MAHTFKPIPTRKKRVRARIRGPYLQSIMACFVTGMRMDPPQYVSKQPDRCTAHTHTHKT